MFERNGILYANPQEEILKIYDAKVTGRMMMLVTFSTGERRVFDAEVLTGEVFEPLSDDTTFRNFKISHGVITWMNEEIDCAPEYIYENSFEYDYINIA